jgi:hypothetical protein
MHESYSPHNHGKTENPEENSTRVVASRRSYSVCLSFPPKWSRQQEKLIVGVYRFALGAAAFALGKKLVTDKTLRLGRSKPAPKAEGH